MSLESAILKHAEAIEKLANAIENASTPVNIVGIDSPVNLVTPKTTDETEEKVEKKARKSKKSEEPKETEEVETKSESKKSVEKDEFDDADSEETEEKVTAVSVKDLAKIKIADGYDRTKIKAEITKLGFEKIADMDQGSLVKLNKFLNELKK